ncbi:PrsW family glutamic-type intramembrane protease [Thermococcus nautili]|uniref:PrsW family intramembrane metalloprotease n=1 Tax=Thermococcus nautili TaxID=195522 RepID=W8P1Q8_9EURY|nr:PrsW family glutamic-type intramembrane protease [Thermococcus nautili]AHL22701.1 hypothetical protein BD01_1084 [Thermococcus nautili]
MDAGHILIIVTIALYSLGSVGVLLWFWWRVRPKLPSALATGIVVVFAFFVVFSIELILAFAIAPTERTTAIPIKQAFKISITEETVKILIVSLGLFIARDDSHWTDTKLTLALIAGLVFGVSEGIVYAANRHYAPLNLVILFTTRTYHAVLTVTLMAGLILVLKGRKLTGALIAASPYLTHAFFDYFVSLRNYVGASVMLILTFALFLAGVYLLLPAIEEEKRTREKFRHEATVNIEDHWLKKM